MDSQRDFVTRQYANLIASGMEDAPARARLRDVLGEAGVDYLQGDVADSGWPVRDDRAARLAETVAGLGGNGAETQAAFIQSLAEARLFALDWWRPARTFLLYIVVLLVVAVVIAAIYSLYTLPLFQDFYRSTSVSGGAADWVLAGGAIRLVAPLVVIAIGVVLLALLWYRVFRLIMRLAPPGRFGWLYGRAGTVYQALLCLEYAAVLKAGSVADSSVLVPALKLADWPAGKPLQTRKNPLGEKLEQAQRLGTFEAELEWQRRLFWSLAQGQLELWRDRLILGARILFYILIGIMLTVLYIPIFSLANVVGVP